MIQARFEMDDYTIRVLDVIKGKFGLKNRSEALKRMAQDVGVEHLGYSPNEAVLKEIDFFYEEHKKKHGNRKMNDKELKGLLNV